MSFFIESGEGVEYFDIKVLLMDSQDAEIKVNLQPEHLSFTLQYLPLPMAGGWSEKLDPDNLPTLSSCRPENQLNDRTIRQLYADAKQFGILDDNKVFHIIDYGKWFGLIDERWAENRWILGTDDILTMEPKERLSGYIRRML